MEFGNLKKRLALGLAGVMAFTMAAPVGLTTGQEASSVDAAEAFEFVASSSISAEEGTVLKVCDIKTDKVNTLYNQKGVRMLEVTHDSKLSEVKVVTGSDLNTVGDPKKDTWTTNVTGGTSVIVGWKDASSSDVNETEAGAIYYYAKSAGTDELKIEGLTDGKVVQVQQSIPVTIVNPYSITADVRTGSSDKTVVSAISMSNVDTYGVYLNVRTSAALGSVGIRVKSATVMNSNPGLVRVDTAGAAKKFKSGTEGASTVSFDWDKGELAADMPVYRSMYKLALIPNPDASGTANLQIRAEYLQGNDTNLKQTAWVDLKVTVNDRKNTLTVEYPSAAGDPSTSSENTDSKLYKAGLVQPKYEINVPTGPVQTAIDSGYAIRMDNSNNTSEINSVSDKNGEIFYEVRTNVGNETGLLNKYLTVSNSGKLSLKDTLPAGVDSVTGVVAVVSTGKADAFSPSNTINVPVRIDRKERGYMLVREGDKKVVAGSKNNVTYNKVVYLSSKDVTEKTLTIDSNIDPDYIKWKSNDEKVCSVEAKGSELTLTCKKTKSGDATTTIEGTITESSNVTGLEKIVIHVTATDLLLTNALTVPNKTIYINYGDEAKFIGASYNGNNQTLFKLAKYNNDTGVFEEDTDLVNNKNNTTSDKALVLGKYDGKLEVKDAKNSGAVYVEVSGLPNDNYRADDTEIVHVFYNMSEDDSKDEITGTSKYTMNVGESQTLDAKSEKESGLTYTSDDTSVATVDGAGKVTAVKPGTAVITVKSTGYDATMNVTIVVNKPAEDQDVVTGKASYSVKVGKTVTSNAESSLGNALTWSSSNTKVATVSKTGVIKGVKAGKATITATAKNSGAELKINVTVSKNNQSLTVTGKKVTKKVALKKNKTTKKITIKKAAALTVKNAQGTVTYKKANGNSKITVNSKTGNITVKKGIKKGTYKVKVTVNAAGNNTYNKASKTATVTIVIKKK